MNDEIIMTLDGNYIVTDEFGNTTRLSDIPSITGCPEIYYEDRLYGVKGSKEINKMAIKFQIQVKVIGLGPADRHARWVDRRIQRMAAEIVKAKMFSVSEEPDDILFARLEGKYGSKRFSKYQIGISRGSVIYDTKNSTWHGTFVVTSKKTKN